MSTLPDLEIHPLPHIDLRHMLALIDDTGMYQHASYGIPDRRHGYCTDDNARALIAIVLARSLMAPMMSAPQRDVSQDANSLGVHLQRLLSFLDHAFNRSTGRYRNFLSFSRQWLEEYGSEDCHARSVWALAVALRHETFSSVVNFARELMDLSLPAMRDFEHPRPWSFALLGLDIFLKTPYRNDLALEIRDRLGKRLFDRWKERAHPDWPWWDDHLTWGNSRLPHGLLVAGAGMQNEEMVDAGLKSLSWLFDMQTAKDGHLSMIGNAGWCDRQGHRAQFDQQPLEAMNLLQASLTAASITGDERWVHEARRAFEWYLGVNDLHLPLYDPDTGGCQDALHSHGVNQNQGAESTLSYVLSVLHLHVYDRMQKAIQHGQMGQQPI